MRVLITGANRGIGAELATLYKEVGAQVIATARNAAGHVPLDVTDPASFQALEEYMSDTPLDLLVCNAGVYLDKGHALTTGYPSQMWAESFAANVTGVFLTVQTLLPNLKLAEGAKIAIMSSQMASDTRAPGGSYIYRASKAAVLNLGRNLSTDLRGLGIAVGIYHPGWVQTDMGGAAAEISPKDSAIGLAREFDALSMATTGAFRTWDGRDHAF